MKGYAEREIFSMVELGLLGKASVLVSRCPFEIGREAVRCHELARAIGQKLDLPHCDGWLGMVEHSWLWLSRAAAMTDGFFLHEVPSILDVYTPGRFPQVSLVSSSRHLPWDYRRGDERKDIRHGVVEALLECMRQEEVRA